MKKRFVVISVIVLILVLVFGIIYLRDKNKVIVYENTYTEDVSNVEDSEDKTISINVVGDLMCHSTNMWDAYNNKSDTFDFSYVFENVKDEIADADITVGNLETTFAGEEAEYSGFPRFNTPERFAKNLKDIGIDVVSTVNNHCLDKDYEGLERTILELDKVGLAHMGTYTTEEDSEQILIKDVKGIKIAFLAYTGNTNDIPIPEDKPFCVNMREEEKVKKDIEKAKSLGADLICVNNHSGTEYSLTPNETQKYWTDFFFSQGVDIILDSHPHVLEPYELREIQLEDGTTKEGFVIYSLGNFVSGQNQPHTQDAIILNLNITKSGETGKIRFNSIKYIPTYMDNTYYKRCDHRFKIYNIEEEIEKYESGDTSIGEHLYNTLKSSLTSIESILGEEYIRN